MNHSRPKPKILIVDDKPQNLYALSKLLGQLKVEVMQANSGVDGLQLSLKHDFCLAIVDVQMPTMDGYEFVELLRSSEGTRTLPVIFVSAIFSDEFNHRKGYEAGAVDFLSKPFNPDILLSKVKVFLDLYHQRARLQGMVQALDEANLQFRKTKMALARRTNQVEIANRVSRLVTSVPDLTVLLEQVTGLIQAQFDYYLVSLWLPDEAGEALVLQTACGREGSRPLEAGRVLPLAAGRSLIAAAARAGAPILANDVTADSRYLAVEELPDTRAELALPLPFRSELLGVLDIQSDQQGAFDDEDQTALQGLACQVAAAIANVRRGQELA